MSNLFKRSTAYKPFKYPWAVENTIDHAKSVWGEWEGQLQEDVNQWKSGVITPAEKEHITQILRLFTQTDVEVGNNYLDVFVPNFKNNEIRGMLVSYVDREYVHQRAYALLNDTLGLDESEYSAFLEFHEMAEKVEFMQAKRFTFDWENDREQSLKNIGYALAQTVCNEGMSLFSAFAMLLNYQLRGKMKGMCEIVEWSLVDESMHIEGMVQLFRAFCGEHNGILTDEFKKEIYDMYRTAVALEDKVIDLTYAMGPVEGLAKDEVKKYIRYLADRRLIQLGLKPNFGVDKNPLPWIEYLITGTSFKNFFEGRVTDYSADGMVGNMFQEDAESLRKKKRIIVYTKPNCPSCIQVKAVLNMKNIAFEEIPLTPDAIQELESSYGVTIRSVPQVVVDGSFVGGYEAFKDRYNLAV